MAYLESHKGAFCLQGALSLHASVCVPSALLCCLATSLAAKCISLADHHVHDTCPAALLQNNAGLAGTSGQNGAAHSNGAVLEAQFADRRASSNGASSNGNGASATVSSSSSSNSYGRRALIQEVRQAEPLTPALAGGSYTSSSSNGAAMDERPEHWADPCEVGQLEACAQER